MNKIKIDEEKCIGCGMCESLCPEVFKMKDGKSYLCEKADLEKNKDCIESTIQSCPTKAVEDEAEE